MKKNINSFFILILMFLGMHVELFSAAYNEDDDLCVGLTATPARILLPKKSQGGGMSLSVVRTVESAQETKIRLLIDSYMAVDGKKSFKKNSKKIRELLKEINKEKPGSLKHILEKQGVLGCNIFQFAAAKNDIKLVEQIMSLYSPILNTITPAHNTALHLAYRYGAKKVISFLEAQPDLNKDQKNIHGLLATQMPKEKNNPLNEMEGFSLEKKLKNEKDAKKE